MLRRRSPNIPTTIRPTPRSAIGATVSPVAGSAVGDSAAPVVGGGAAAVGWSVVEPEPAEPEEPFEDALDPPCELPAEAVGGGALGVPEPPPVLGGVLPALGGLGWY